MAHEAAKSGRLIGRYLVHDRIAAGGMATVHLGRLLGAAGFSRTVAIKRLHDGYARDPEFVAMLLDEARLAATIRHPNVVPTLDVVAEEDALLVVMEYVEGDSLAQLVKVTQAQGTGVPPAFAVSIVAQALHGLHAAHEARDKNGEHLGIVHRDVSPQNILVGIDGVARVLDFGIAKAASRSTSTEDGQIKGKAAYMAPEQLQHAAVDRRTDIFAAAVVLWELLAKRRLFLADSPAATMSRVLSEPIDPPHRWAPDLPPELSLVVLRGLERDPNGRFATAEEMALALEDTIALPRAKEVGAWVADVAAATLARRAEIVREVERSSHRIPAAPSTDPALLGAIAEAERRRQIVDMPTDVGAGRPTPMTPPSFAPISSRPIMAGNNEVTELATVNSTQVPAVNPGVSRTSLFIGALGVGALVTAIIVGFFATRARVNDVPPTTATNVPSAPAVVADAAVAGGQEPPPVTTTPAPPPPPASTPVRVTAPATTTKRPAGKVTPSTKPDCRIPYVLDDKGLKHFRPECL